ncbi:KR domain-containing protein [Hirsutella rhossiliensis]|uniref:KR domain-containing protein n=1 Tax=Hirsutella rhossiliensis TaxID=111463 RepID=A0A9P8N5R3_9HYPO|nr:KR domain-containing protein [Hirsutella rhossiliensis]KAH0966461.1 KR domain-containing protein [Hirsutella rhossiliensis]
MLDTMTWEQWKGALGPKVQDTKNLDDLFAGPDVDLFIVLSSVTSVVGNMGQSNYTAGGTQSEAAVVEALRERLADSLALVPLGIETGVPLSTYGVDSLVAVELRNWLGTNLLKSDQA